ncbi:MAG: type II secretion system F family protein [Actinomycetota bacterium]
MSSLMVGVVVAALIVGGLGVSRPFRRDVGLGSTHVPTPDRSDGVGAIRRWRAWRRSRGHPQPDAIAAWLDEVGRSLRRGESATAALSVTPRDPRLALDSVDLRRALARGVPVASATDAWSTERTTSSRGRDHTTALSVCSTVIAAATEVGGSLAEPIDRLAAAMRERAELDRERSTQSAQARMSAVVLVCLPVVVLGVLLVADPEVRRLVMSPLGIAVVTSGLLLDAIGGWWMHRIVGGAW